MEEDVRQLEAMLLPLPEPRRRPLLVAVSGLPGSGKSQLSRRIAAEAPVAVLESDALRKALFPEPTYSAPESSRLFRAVHALAAKLLRQRVAVILDATSLQEEHRWELRQVAERAGARLVLVWVEAPEVVVAERLRARVAYGPQGHSDADLEVYQRLKANAQEIREPHLRVDTSRDVEPVVRTIVEEIRSA